MWLTIFAATQEGNSVVAPCGLHSSRRQSGTGLSPDFYGRVETPALPKFRLNDLFARLGLDPE
jgi:hypothetical protein